MQHPFTLWHVPVILTGIGISSLDIKLPSIWIHKKQDKILYIGWLVTGGTNGKGVILREKRSRKYRIKIFRLRLCFRENRLWILFMDILNQYYKYWILNHIKSIVYSEEIASCEQLKEKIIVAFHTLKQSNTLESVHRNLIRRAEVCVRQNGQHFRQFL